MREPRRPGTCKENGIGGKLGWSGERRPRGSEDEAGQETGQKGSKGVAVAAARQRNASPGALTRLPGLVLGVVGLGKLADWLRGAM